jgi:hypothetical protein
MKPTGDVPSGDGTLYEVADRSGLNPWAVGAAHE